LVSILLSPHRPRYRCIEDDPFNFVSFPRSERGIEDEEPDEFDHVAGPDDDDERRAESVEEIDSVP